MNEDRRTTLMLSVIGFILGMFMCTGITMMFASTADHIVLVAPELSERFGKTLAIIVQMIIGGIIGAVAFVSTKVYYDERLSIVAATLIHMAISMSVLLIGGYFLEWVGHTVEELMLFMILPVCIYVLIWFSVYMSYRIQIRQINESLERRRSGKQ